jgi:serine/threonine protein phosphatase PrpC
LAGDRLLFCTDGVTRIVSELEMKVIVATAADPEEIAHGLVELAVERGGPDNATAVAVIIDSV